MCESEYVFPELFDREDCAMQSMYHSPRQACENDFLRRRGLGFNRTQQINAINRRLADHDGKLPQGF